MVDIHKLTNQIEYLYSQDRNEEARAFLDNLPKSVDLGQSYIREMLADAYVMADDVEYFYDWYKQHLFQKEASEGDQILVYALLCHNRNREALEVFDKVFPALATAKHFTNALKHVPQLIEDRSQRAVYYKKILEKSQAAIACQSEHDTQADWYEILLQVNYCLGDTPGFERTIYAMSQVYPEVAQRHLVFLERMLDIGNPKWKGNKVFGIGLSKTGTSSLSKALVRLGFSTAHWTNPYSHDLLTKEDIPLFDSLTDISISYQYKDIYKEYPDAKFVLTTRTIEKWEKSFLTHYARSVHASDFESLRSIIHDQHPPRFGQRYVDMHQELYFRHPNLLEAYRAHKQSVLDFFEGRENQLLLLDVSESNALQNLADFLQVDCPQTDFPYENTKEEKNSWVSPISGERRVFKFKT